jgi:hypothetical protein
LSSVPTDGRRSLGEYIEALVEELGRADPAALARMQDVVGSRRARVVLDDESVDVQMVADALVVETSSADAVDGEGTIDRGTVLDLIDGYVDVADAILDGRLDVRGSVDDVQRIFAAIEILLDASARAPALQRLARDFRGDPCPPPHGRPVRASAQEPWYPPVPGADEIALLARLDLLPDPP